MNRFSLYAFLLIFLFACSNFTAPSVSDAKEAAESMMKNNPRLNGLVSIESFEQANTREYEILGKKVYVIEFLAKLKFLSSGGYTLNASNQWDPAEEGWVGRRISGNPGDVVSVKGKIFFEKRNNKWVIDPSRGI